MERGESLKAARDCPRREIRMHVLWEIASAILVTSVFVRGQAYRQTRSPRLLSRRAFAVRNALRGVGCESSVVVVDTRSRDVGFLTDLIANRRCSRAVPVATGLAS